MEAGRNSAVARDRRRTAGWPDGWAGFAVRNWELGRSTADSYSVRPAVQHEVAAPDYKAEKEDWQADLLAVLRCPVAWGNSPDLGLAAALSGLMVGQPGRVFQLQKKEVYRNRWH